MDYSSSGISSPNSLGASEEDLLLQVMDLKKKKRMISNRESARRSRLRKQNHMEELAAQVAQLRRQNHQILTSLRSTTHHHLTVESENSILRAQAAELTHRLHSLLEMIDAAGFPEDDGLLGGSWNCLTHPMLTMAQAFPADSGLLY